MFDSHPADRETELAKLEALAAFGQKRRQRASARLDAAVIEFSDAIDAHRAATARLAAWVEANPDPQSSLLDLITPEGDEK